MGCASHSRCVHPRLWLSACKSACACFMINLEAEGALQGVFEGAVPRICTEGYWSRDSGQKMCTCSIQHCPALIQTNCLMQDLTYSVKSHHDKKVTLNLLSSISGFFNSGEMSALVSTAL